MDWNNLKSCCCPKCYGNIPLSKKPEIEMFICQNTECGFIISFKRFTEILYSLSHPKRFINKKQ